MFIGRFCVVRTRNAGVHMGTLVESNGTAVVLKDALRLWRWRGANSLHEVSLKGVDREWSRISEPVAEILLTEALEIIPATAVAEKNLKSPRWGS